MSKSNIYLSNFIYAIYYAIYIYRLLLLYIVYYLFLLILLTFQSLNTYIYNFLFII